MPHSTPASLSLTDLTADQLVVLQDHGVDPEFVQALLDIGYGDIRLSELIDMVDQGVTAAFISQLPRTDGDELTPAPLIEQYRHKG